MKKILLSILLLTVCFIVFVETNIYNPQTSKYLGKLGGSQYDPDSTNNPYGRYGSKYSADSINNPYGVYGSKYSDKSPNNPYSNNSPIIINNIK